EHEEGKVVTYEYLPNTNLVTAKLTYEGSKVVLRELARYDECNNLIEKIEDHKITRYHLRQTAPFLYLPESIEELCDQGLLKRTHLTYDERGNVVRETVYGADGKLAYAIDREYNERGDLLSETNPLGQRATYSYDEKGRRTTTQPFSNRLTTTSSYDLQGRLLQSTDHGDEGTVHTTSYSYDFKDRCTQTTDPLSNTTSYVYDPLTDKPIQINQSQILTSSTYDALGREISKTDANGNTTTTTYNAYGLPLEIIHPNGSKETFHYSKSGELISHIDQEGLSINYQRDVLGRVLQKTYHFQGQIAEETFTYDGPLLIQETDKEGHITKYLYDGAGRKIQTSRCGRKTEYAYDPLSRLSTLTQHNGKNTLITYYKRDLLDRVVQVSKTDASGQLLYLIDYSYDAAGNRSEIIRNINGQQAVETFVYDPFNRLIEHRDPTGSSTTTVYHELEKTLQVIHTNPLQVSTVKTYNAHYRLVKEERFSPERIPLFLQEKVYDLHGNLISQADQVYVDGRKTGLQITRYAYTLTHHIERLMRAFGTKEARTTSYTYTPSGRLATKTTPNGKTLSYNYSPLGFLTERRSSDGAISHSFTYNKLGRLTSAVDEVQNIAIDREVDPFGNVLRERFPSGLEVKKEYDALDRPLSLTFGQEGAVFYSYDPLYLRKVERYSPTGQLLYTHERKGYDLSGHLTCEELIGDLGQISYTTDQCGRKESLVSPYFSQHCHYDGCGNLVACDEEENHTYTYDDLSQLTSEVSKSNAQVYQYDSLHNRLSKNEKTYHHNSLNELTQVKYDLNGNQLVSGEWELVYDPLNQLIEAKRGGRSLQFAYDPFGRRLSATIKEGGTQAREEYLYDGQEEIGSFTPDLEVQNLKILGKSTKGSFPSTIAIEVDGKPFAPVIDVQGNVRHLLDLKMKKVVNSYAYSAFGEPLETYEKVFNPWRYAAKRIDPEL
ncbi:MAG: RHS repeat protein, partial [Verrucomicrobia bacterium]|nr:RHS repeat protein [Verrucomicrobiota bacterium]